MDVLVFGAGTNYALLLIARYREELRRDADRRAALRRALSSAGPAIAASAATVCLSLLTLITAVLGNERAIGVAGAAGIAVAALFGLVVLPAAAPLILVATVVATFFAALGASNFLVPAVGR